MGQTSGGAPVVEFLLRRFGGYKTALTGLRDDTARAIDKGTGRTDGRGGAQPLEHGETLCQDKAVRKEYKNKRFVHTDIRPFCELDEGTKEYDRCISECLPLVAEQ